MKSKAILAAIGMLVAIGGAQAQYPERAIKVVLGFSAGGSIDGSARVAAQILTESLGKPVVVENQVGAGGSIAANAVAKAAPDGYTLFVNAPADVINPAANKQSSYSLETSFVPIGLIANVPNVLVIHPSVPANSLAELIAYAKAKPGALSYGSAGIGTVSHLAGALLGALAKIQIVHIPYKGTSAAQADLLSGRLPFMFDSMVSALPSAKAGKLKAIAVTSAERWSSAPELPTVSESGFPGVNVTTWIGIHAPVGTPPAIILRLSDILLKVLQTREVRERLAGIGGEPGKYTPEEFGAFIRAESGRWRKVFDEGLVKLEN